MKPIILDSALGTELENRGEYLPSYKTSIWSAYSLIYNPEVIKQIHIDNIEYKKFVEDWINQGASVIGGCCRTTTDHIKEIKKILNK